MKWLVVDPTNEQLMSVLLDWYWHETPPTRAPGTTDRNMALLEMQDLLASLERAGFKIVQRIEGGRP